MKKECCFSIQLDLLKTGSQEKNHTTALHNQVFLGSILSYPILSYPAVQYLTTCMDPAAAFQLQTPRAKHVHRIHCNILPYSTRREQREGCHGMAMAGRRGSVLVLTSICISCPFLLSAFCLPFSPPTALHCTHCPCSFFLKQEKISRSVLFCSRCFPPSRSGGLIFVQCNAMQCNAMQCNAGTAWPGLARQKGHQRPHHAGRPAPGDSWHHRPGPRASQGSQPLVCVFVCTLCVPTRVCTTEW